MLAWLTLAVALRAAYAGKALPGTRMAGVALAGASASEVRGRLAAAPGSVVTLTHGTARSTVPGKAAGLDLSASAERAMEAGRKGPLGGLWSSVVSLFAPRVVAPVYPSERAAVEVVAAAAREIDRPPFFGALSIDPRTRRVTPVLPRAGQAVDRLRTARALVDALRRGDGGEVPMTVHARPTVAPADVRAVGRQAEQLLGAGLRLRGAGRPVRVTPRQLAPILALERVERVERTAGTRVRLGVRRERLAGLVDSIANDRDRDPVDARIIAPARIGLLAEKLDVGWRPRPARVRVRPSRPGRTVRQDAAIAAVTAAVRDGRDAALLPRRTVPARLSTSAARKVNALIGTFTTSFPCCEPRVTNIRLIAEAVDGTVVAPDERFSLNGIVGPRTRAKGYVPAPFISDGKLEDSVGGGVSQMSTTVYNAAYFAGLHIDTHTPHSFYISRYPPGREATLDYPGIDLAWTNDTHTPVLVRATTTATSVSVSLYGDNGGRRARAQSGPRNPVQGGDFAVTVTRKIRQSGGRIRNEPYTTTYDVPPPP